MKLNKPFFKEVLDNTVKLFQQHIIKLPHQVEVKFQSREEYMDSVKQNPLIQQQIQLGFYKDIDKEYVGFAVVYEKDKFEMKALLGLPYSITICDEIAKDVLKPFNSKEVKAYLTHVYLHELTHIFEREIKKQHTDIWDKSLQIANNHEVYAKELFAEYVADLVSKNKDIYNSVENKLWLKVRYNMEKVKKQRGMI